MEFRPFDTKSFLKASQHWDEDIKQLQEELDNMPELPAMSSNNGIRSGEVSDLTSRMALRRLEIASKIEGILLYKEMLDFALKQLTKDERRIVNGFFFPKKPIGVFVLEYGKEKGLGKNLVYGERERVMKKIGRVIEEVYYGD